MVAEERLERSLTGPKPIVTTIRRFRIISSKWSENRGTIPRLQIGNLSCYQLHHSRLLIEHFVAEGVRFELTDTILHSIGSLAKNCIRPLYQPSSYAL